MKLRFLIAFLFSKLSFLPFFFTIVRIIYHPDNKRNNISKLIKIDNAIFKCLTNSYIEYCIIFFKGNERGLLKYFTHEIKSSPYDYFLDLGANIGFFSIPISYYIDTFSYEPLSINFNKLKENVSLNKTSNKLKLFNYGLSNKFKLAPIYLNENYSNFGNASLDQNFAKTSNVKEVIELKILDSQLSFKNKKILIKIDIEGHELSALEGMISLLKNNSCHLYVESNNFEVENFFEGLGYKAYYLKNNLYKKIKFSKSFEGHFIFKNF